MITPAMQVRKGAGRRGAAPLFAEILFVEHDGNRLLYLFDSLLCKLGFELRFDLRPHFVQRFESVLFDLDDVITELRLYRIADLAYRKRECSLLEGRNHATVPESAERSAVRAGTR